MPYSHNINANSGFGVISLYGTVTGTELLGALAWFYDHEDWVPGARVLWDGRAVEDFVLTPEELHAAAEMVEEAAGRLGIERTAVVAGNLDSYMGGSLLAARLGKRTGREARTFSVSTAALEWLATPSPHLRADDLLSSALVHGDGFDFGVKAAVFTVRGVGPEEAGPEGAD